MKNLYYQRKRYFLSTPALYRICFFVVCFSVLQTFGQTPIITGKVVNVTGAPVSGATVWEKGTVNGVVTDKSGAFSLQASSNGTLIVAHAGFETRKIKVEEMSTGEVSLLPAPEKKERKEKNAQNRSEQTTQTVSTGAQLSSKDIKPVFSTDILSGINGQVSGAYIGGNGTPGTFADIRLRGMHSFQQQRPLIVLDGVPVSDFFIQGIKPEDIASVRVLKDVASAAFYGSRGGNGVIELQTYKGKAGKIQIMYDMKTSMQTSVGKPNLTIDPEEYAEIFRQSYGQAGRPVPGHSPYAEVYSGIPAYIFPAQSSGVDESAYAYPDNLITQSNAEGTDWWDEVFGPASISHHTLNISGGTSQSQFFISAGYLSQEGTMKHTSFERLSLRINAKQQADKFTFGQNLGLARTKTLLPPSGLGIGDGIISDIFKTQSILPVFDVSGEHFAGGNSPGLHRNPHPLATLERNKDNDATMMQVVGNMYAELEITDKLKAKTDLGLSYGHFYRGAFKYPVMEIPEPDPESRWEETWHQLFSWNWRNTLTYDTYFLKAHHMIASAGYEALNNYNRTIQGGMSQYISFHPATWYLQNTLASQDSRYVRSAGNLNTLNSAFGTLHYSYKDKYLLDASIRRDGYSGFSKQKFAIFPAYRVGWRLSEEKFFRKMGWIDDLVVHYGWGQAGILPGNSMNLHDAFSGSPESTYYDISGTNTLATGYGLSRRGNRMATFETRTETNIGLEATLFKGFMTIALDGYESNSDHLLLSSILPGTAGLSSGSVANVGKMANKGFDLNLQIRPKMAGIDLKVGIIVSRYKNTILSLGEGVEFMLADWGLPMGETVIDLIENPIGGFYGYVADGIFQSQNMVDKHATQEGAAVGRIRFEDVNQDGIIDDLDKGLIGSPHPDLTGGISVDLTWGNLDAHAIFTGSKGNQIFNYQKLYSVFRYRDANVQQGLLEASFDATENPNGWLPSLDVEDIYSRTSSSFYIEDGSFIRLSSLQIGYSFNLPFFRKWGVDKFRVYGQGQNLFTLTAYTGVDPVLPFTHLPNTDRQWAGFDVGTYPSARMMSVGAQISF